MSSDQLLTLIEERVDPRIVGMDCVDVVSVYDHAELTRMAAANFVVTNLARCVAARDG